MSRALPIMALGAALILAVSAGAKAQSAAPGASTPPSSSPAPGAAPSAPAPAPTPTTTTTETPAPPPPGPPPAPTAAPPPPPPAPAPAPSPPAPSPPAPKAKAEPPRTKAFVHLFVTFPNAQLELQSTVDDTGWRAACKSPCDREIDVDAMEARVTAPGMTTSNPFAIEPGRGTARFKVNGGSASSRQIGIITMAAGIPISLTGMGLYGYGVLEESKGLRTAGIVTLAIGGATVLAALPFLGSGSTRVYDARGKNVASRFTPPPL